MSRQVVEDYSVPLRQVALAVDWGVAQQEDSRALEEGPREGGSLEIDPLDCLETLVEVWGEPVEEEDCLDRTHRPRPEEDCLILAVGWEGEREGASFKHHPLRVSGGRVVRLLVTP